MGEGIIPAELQKTINKYYPYLMEIRKRLFFVAALFLISGIVGFFYFEKFVTIILKLLDVTGVNIVFTSPFQFIELAVNSGFIVGLVVIIPVTIWQLLSFLKPALRPKEYKLIVTLLPLSIILFAGGFIFGFAIMKYVITLFYEKSVQLEIGNYLDITFLLSKIVLTGILMGFAFQFPIVLTVLMKLKVVEYKEFVKQRILAWSISLIFAALLPPTDLLSLALLTLPLVILFELTLLLNRVFLKSHL
jgi:sec-independent protein translocase protein TatC